MNIFVPVNVNAKVGCIVVSLHIKKKHKWHTSNS